MMNCVEAYGGHPLSALAISTDGTRFVTVTSHGAVELWDRATETCIDAGFTSTSVPAAAVAADGTWLATGSDDSNVRIWDTATCSVTSILSGHTKTVHAVAIAPDGTWLATGDGSGEIRVWDRAGGVATAVLSGTVSTVHGLAISPNGRFIASVDGGGEMRIWERESRQTVALMRTDGALWACSWTPDGTAVIAVGDNGVYCYTFVVTRHLAG
jgi:WD40 repeat protein